MPGIHHLLVVTFDTSATTWAGPSTIVMLNMTIIYLCYTDILTSETCKVCERCEPWFVFFNFRMNSTLPSRFENCLNLCALTLNPSDSERHAFPKMSVEDQTKSPDTGSIVL
jgi:hypothetical protein